MVEVMTTSAQEPPAETISLPRRQVTQDDSDTINRLLQKLRNHRRRGALRASYYDGKRAIRQIGTVIPPQYYNLGIVLGWSAKAVDILARRCNLDAFVWPDGDIGSLGFDEFVDENYFYAEASQAFVSSLIHGVVFAINTEGDTDEDEPKSLVHFKDALNATGDWNSRRRRMDNLLSITSRDAEGHPTGLALYEDGRTIVAGKENGRWVADPSEHDFGVPVEALPYKPRAGRPTGTSRISRAVMSLHDQALRTVIRLEGHADVYSYPEMWMLGADESIFQNTDGTQKATWQVVLGRIKGIPDDDEAPSDALARADVKQFPAASPQPHLDTLRQQAELFAGETSIPLSSLGISDKGNPTSSDSYIASREDLIAEAEGATDDWSPPLRRTIARALAIRGDLQKIPDEWLSIGPKWRSPLHLSRAAQADAGSKQLSAVEWLKETEVGLELLGLDDQQVKRAMAQKPPRAEAPAQPAPPAAPPPLPSGLPQTNGVRADTNA